jgi:hypothetical protein
MFLGGMFKNTVYTSQKNNSSPRQTPIDMDTWRTNHTCNINCVGKMQTFLGAFIILQKAIISFGVSVCLPVRKTSAPTGRIFIEFDSL